jgi:hypothetical protein
MDNRFWRATLVLFNIILPIDRISHARAHDHQRPQLNGWYASLRSGKGSCCNGTDAKRADDADWDTKDDRRRVGRCSEGRCCRRTQPRWPHNGLALLSAWSSEGMLLYAREHGLTIDRAENDA